MSSHQSSGTAKPARLHPVAVPSATHVPHPVPSHPGNTNWLLCFSKGLTPKEEGELFEHREEKEPGSHLPLLLGSSSIDLILDPS